MARNIRFHPDTVKKIIKDGGRLDFAHSLDAAAQAGTDFLARPHLRIERYQPAQGHPRHSCCWQTTATGPMCGARAEVSILDPIAGTIALLCLEHTHAACLERIEKLGTDAERAQVREHMRGLLRSLLRMNLPRRLRLCPPIVKD